MKMLARLITDEDGPDWVRREIAEAFLLRSVRPGAR